MTFCSCVLVRQKYYSNYEIIKLESENTILSTKEEKGNIEKKLRIKILVKEKFLNF